MLPIEEVNGVSLRGVPLVIFGLIKSMGPDATFRLECHRDDAQSWTVIVRRPLIPWLTDPKRTAEDVAHCRQQYARILRRQQIIDTRVPEGVIQQFPKNMICSNVALCQYSAYTEEGRHHLRTRFHGPFACKCGWSAFPSNVRAWQFEDAFFLTARAKRTRELIMHPTEHQDNFTLAIDGEFWRTVMDVETSMRNYSKGGVAGPPFRAICFNFGKWESAVSSGEHTCHAHAHLFLDEYWRRALVRFGVHALRGRTNEPDLYTKDDIALLDKFFFELVQKDGFHRDT